MYFNPGCPVMKSKDLVNWEIVNYAYDILDSGEKMTLKNGQHAYGAGSWASCIRYHKGIYYVVFCANNTGKTYICQTEDIENGLWKRYTIDGIYHDMSILFDDDGRVYMVYGGGQIKVIELTPDATGIKPDGLNKVIIENADISGGNSLAEGAHIYKINGRYYIFIICWPRSGTGRRIEVCYRSDNIDGEYEGRIILDDDMGFRNAGVAQGGIVDTPEGEWYAPLFQDHGAVGRVPVLVPMKWEDGWPVLGTEGKVPAELMIPVAGYEPKSIVISDDFDQKDIYKDFSAINDSSYKSGGAEGENDYNGSNLALEWQWNHNPDNRYWSLTARPGWLRLVAGSISRSLSDARNTLTQRTFGPECSGSVFIDTSRMRDGDYTGLAALQDRYGFIGVKMSGNSKYIIMAKAGDEPSVQPGQRRRYETGVPELEIESVPLAQDTVYLRIDFDFKDAIDEAVFYYSLDGAEWHKIGDTLNMPYRLTHFTGYRFALFNYATKVIGGYVDFDWFRIINS
jgi:beta-xylosidase